MGTPIHVARMFEVYVNVSCIWNWMIGSDYYISKEFSFYSEFFNTTLFLYMFHNELHKWYSMYINKYENTVTQLIFWQCYWNLSKFVWQRGELLYFLFNFQIGVFIITNSQMHFFCIFFYSNPKNKPKRMSIFPHSRKKHSWWP